MENTIFDKFIEVIRSFGYYVEPARTDDETISYASLRINSPVYTEKLKKPLTLSISSKPSENYLKLSTSGFFKIEDQELNLMLQTCAVLNVSVAPVIFQYNYIEKSVEVGMSAYLCDLEITPKLSTNMFVQVSQAADVSLELFEETRNRRTLLTNEEMQTLFQNGINQLGQKIADKMAEQQSQTA